jgi:hypothetical protein
MKAVVLFLPIFLAVTIASAQPVIVIVRHAEKSASDDLNI